MGGGFGVAANTEVAHRASIAVMPARPLADRILVDEIIGAPRM